MQAVRTEVAKSREAEVAVVEEARSERGPRSTAELTSAPGPIHALVASRRRLLAPSRKPAALSNTLTARSLSLSEPKDVIPVPV